MQNGAAQGDRKLLNFSEFWLFFTFVQKRLFMQSSSEKHKFISRFVIILGKKMQKFLQNGDVQSQKLSKFQKSTKSPY